MGGRGTFAAGRNVGYTYKTVGTIERVKVLEPIDPKSSHRLPEEAHLSESYIVLDKKNGVFRQYREYDADHLPTLEIGYHFENRLSENGQNVFHIHEYSRPGIEHRQRSRLMTPSEIYKYKKFFKGVTQEQINQYLTYYRRVHK